MHESLVDTCLKLGMEGSTTLFVRARNAVVRFGFEPVLEPVVFFLLLGLVVCWEMISGSMNSNYMYS